MKNPSILAEDEGETPGKHRRKLSFSDKRKRIKAFEDDGFSPDVIAMVTGYSKRNIRRLRRTINNDDFSFFHGNSSGC
jgi:hypothetical protein